MPADQLQWFKFEPDKWIRDTALRSVSLAARGLWIDLLCLMDRSPTRGVLLMDNGTIPTTKLIGKLVSSSPLALGKLLVELESSGVLSRGSSGEYICRKMVRDTEIRQQNSENGSKGGNPSLKPTVKPPVKADIEKSRVDKRREDISPPPLDEGSETKTASPKRRAPKRNAKTVGSERFETLWAFYEAKGSKPAAWEQWQALDPSPDTDNEAWEELARGAETWVDQREKPYRPDLERWLRDRKFESDPGGKAIEVSNGTPLPEWRNPTEAEWAIIDGED